MAKHTVPTSFFEEAASRGFCSLETLTVAQERYRVHTPVLSGRLDPSSFEYQRIQREAREFEEREHAAPRVSASTPVAPSALRPATTPANDHRDGHIGIAFT